MTCQDIMTQDLVCCTPRDTAQRAAQLMRDRNVGPIPICEREDNKVLIGMVTDRDLALRVIAEGRNPATTPLGEVMTKDIVFCRPDDDLDAALRLMEEQKVRRIPVVDRQNRIIGIIAQADVATRLRDTDKTAEVVSEISKPARTRTA